MLFTVFTPVYNRRDLIHRVWDSLCAQTFRDFEWVVVDDGSTDNVVELLQQYAGKSDFPVRIHQKQNGGKHTAWNVGLEMAQGEFFVPLDHDDMCVPEALERFRYWWGTIPEARRPRFSGVNVLCTDPATGGIVGSPYPASPIVSQNLELEYVHHVTGEKWGMIRTDVLREFPYPADEQFNRCYFSESYLWFQIARRYKVLCVNEPLRLFFRDAGNSITDQRLENTWAARSRHHVPTRYFFKNWHLNHNLDYLVRDKRDLLKTALDVWISGMMFKGSIGGILRDARMGLPLFVRLAAMPGGLAAYLYCRHAQARLPEITRKVSPGGAVADASGA